MEITADIQPNVFNLKHELFFKVISFDTSLLLFLEYLLTFPMKVQQYLCNDDDDNDCTCIDFLLSHRQGTKYFTFYF